jgi:hypothetical protein
MAEDFLTPIIEENDVVDVEEGVDVLTGEGLAVSLDFIVQSSNEALNIVFACVGYKEVRGHDTNLTLICSPAKTERAFTGGWVAGGAHAAPHSHTEGVCACVAGDRASTAGQKALCNGFIPQIQGGPQIDF